MNLKLKLLLLISCCIVFVSVMLGLISSKQVEKYLIEQVHLRLNESSAKIKDKLNTILSDRNELLIRLANHTSLSLYLTPEETVDKMQIEDLLLLMKDFFDEISFIDNQGVTIAKVKNKSLDVQLGDSSEKTFFQKMITGRDNNNHIFELEPSGTAFRSTSRVLDLYEEAAGLITGLISFSMLHDIINDTIKLDRNSIYIVDKNGTVLGQGGTIEQQIDNSFIDYPHTVSSPSETGFFSEKVLSLKINGVDSYVQFLPLSTFDLGIVSTIPVREVREKISSLKNILLIATLAIISIGFMLAFFFARTISNRLNQLSGFAKQISTGDYSSRIIADTKDEIGTLAASFNSMVEELESLHNNLEKKVREKTKELNKSYKNQSLVNKVLRFGFEEQKLHSILEKFILHVTSIEELGLQPRGAVFLVEDDPQTLVLQAHRNLAAPLKEICNKVPFGRCVCGRAAQSKKTIFVNCIDEKHDNQFEGIKPHGHYALPIIASDNKLLGVFTVYVNADETFNHHVEDLLSLLAAALASIIENKLMEQARLEDDEKYRAITTTANDAIILMNSKGEITYWNPAASEIFGYSVDEVLGHDLHNLITPPQYHDSFKNGLEKFKQTGEGNAIGKTLDMTALKKDGTEFPVELSLSAFQVKEGWSAVGLVRDISERKEAESERVKLQTQLRQAQKMESIGTLAGGIAHDFNNILTSILGYADLVKEAVETNSEAMEDVDQVLQAANRAKKLVQQILAFSRQTEQELMPVQVSLIVKEAMKLLRATIPSTIEIRQNIMVQEGTVLADPTQVHQIIMNMCTNSFQAMHDGGTLSITLDDKQPGSDFLEVHPDVAGGSFVGLHVADTGCGMEHDTLSRVFEPYFSTKKKQDGTGLGLSVVHGIVTGMGGGITVASKIGEGTVFSIYLPRVAEETSTEVQEKPEIPRGTEHVLYVDDELPIVNLAKRRLESLGYRVSTRTSSVEALEAFRNHPDRYDLVVTDLSMPNMNGINLVSEILAIRPDIPAILCTGYTGYEERELTNKIDDSGFIEVLVKPPSKEQLGKTIRRVLDGEEKAA